MDNLTAAQLQAQLDAKQALMDLSSSPETMRLLEKLTAAQRACDDADLVDDRAARNVESAMSYLRMALEASGVRF